MAKRARLLQPDTVTPTRLGDIPTVSREAIVNALMDGEAMLAMAGGVLEVVVERAETGVPDERVTVAALIRWKDRAFEDGIGRDFHERCERVLPPVPRLQEVPQRVGGGRPERPRRVVYDAKKHVGREPAHPAQLPHDRDDGAARDRAAPADAVPAARRAVGGERRERPAADRRPAGADRHRARVPGRDARPG
jgi:hypothetical protein